MNFDDLSKLAQRSLLLSLDRIIGPRLIKVVYLLGLAGGVLLAVSHIFATFGAGFGAGLWGLAEILIFGLFGVITLRVVCEALIVYFKANGHEADAGHTTEIPVNLIDEVRDAIEDLAADDPEPTLTKTTPAKVTAPKAKTAAPRKTTAAAKPRAKTSAKTLAKATTKPKPTAE